ncbi:MAG: hypothetical protein ACTSYO_00225 [Candidatus Ranarchaeia archaeon]
MQKAMAIPALLLHNTFKSPLASDKKPRFLASIDDPLKESCTTPTRDI